jgi:hypothetical protein
MDMDDLDNDQSNMPVFANIFNANDEDIDDDPSLLLSTDEDDTDDEDIMDEPDTDIDYIAEGFTANPFHPFKNEFEKLTLLFFKSGQDNYSHRLMKNIMAFTEAYCKAAMKAIDSNCGPQDYDPESDFPSFSNILRHSKRKRTQIPVMKTDEYAIQKGDQTYTMHLNKPSEYIRLLLRNKEKSNRISCLSDRTPNTRSSLNQGSKWLYDPEFRCPMIVGDSPSKNMWIGDSFRLLPSSNSSNASNATTTYIISNFFKYNDKNYCEAYQLYDSDQLHEIDELHDVIVDQNSAGIAFHPAWVDLALVDYQSIKRYSSQQRSRFISVTNTEGPNGSSSLSLANNGAYSQLSHHHSLFMMKVGQVHDKAASFGVSKVKLIPLTLFSDDTSGNTTKKWNCYDSWIMTPAALSLQERNKYENQFFLCTHHNLNAMDSASPLVDDLKLLEDGLKMYDVEYDENILVYAPVLFITGDNVRHAEIVCHKGSRATCPCRKCYWQLDPVQPRNTPVQPAHTSVVDYIAEPRLKHHIVQFAVDRLPRLPFPGVALKNRGRGANRDPNESTSIMESSLVIN